MNPLVIYHGSGCQDGFTSSFVAWLHLVKMNRHEHTEFFAAQYGKPPPDVRGRNVYMIDFSYNRTTLEKMANDANSLIVLDHHKTAANDLQGLPYCTFDLTKSGANLAWEYFSYLPAPKLIKYVEDKDLWLFRLPHSKEVNAVITSYAQNFANWEILLDRLETDFDAVVKEGSAILRHQEELVNTIINLQAHEVTFLGHQVMAANTPVLVSEVASTLAINRPLGIAWYRRADGKFIYSLRSVLGSDGKPVHYAADVSELAKNFGGGGHPTAAGFQQDTLIF